MRTLGYMVALIAVFGVTMAPGLLVTMHLAGEVWFWPFLASYWGGVLMWVGASYFFERYDKGRVG